MHASIDNFTCKTVYLSALSDFYQRIFHKTSLIKVQFLKHSALKWFFSYFVARCNAPLQCNTVER